MKYTTCGGNAWGFRIPLDLDMTILAFHFAAARLCENRSQYWQFERFIKRAERADIDISKLQRLYRWGFGINKLANYRRVACNNDNSSLANEQ